MMIRGRAPLARGSIVARSTKAAAAGWAANTYRLQASADHREFAERRTGPISLVMPGAASGGGIIARPLAATTRICYL